MENYQYFFQKIHLLTGVDIFCYHSNQLIPLYVGIGPNPIAVAPGLLKKLTQKANDQSVPVVYQDEFQVLFVCIKKDEAYYLAGPMSLSNMRRIELHRYCVQYLGSVKMERNLPVFAFSKALAFVGLLAKVILNKEYSLEDLIRGNRMAEQLEKNIEQEQILFLMEDEKDTYHHTYSEECELLACVRDGRVEDALTYNMRIDITTGRMSKSEITHWKNVVVVAIALCIRAAIEGGIPPKEAYQLSDFYIQKSDECRNVSELIALRNRAIRELTERVNRKNAAGKKSNYVERCKDYIAKHYSEKIIIDDIARELGISRGYLSKRFKDETGITWQEYVIQFRVRKAADLLKYSDKSIAHISECVNFSSQSYFGERFKKYMKMTPREYREKYKPSEF